MKTIIVLTIATLAGGIGSASADDGVRSNQTTQDAYSWLLDGTCEIKAYWIRPGGKGGRHKPLSGSYSWELVSDNQAAPSELLGCLEAGNAVFDQCEGVTGPLTNKKFCKKNIRGVRISYSNDSIDFEADVRFIDKKAYPLRPWSRFNTTVSVDQLEGLETETQTLETVHATLDVLGQGILGDAKIKFKDKNGHVIVQGKSTRYPAP